MRKTAIIILVALTFAACGGLETKVETVDSTLVDSAAVEQIVADTNTAHIPVTDPVGGGSATHEQPIK